MADFTIEPIVVYSSVNGLTYNCFTSLDDADGYHGRRLNNNVWRSADEDTRTSALFHATDILHRQKWIGAPLDYDQKLSWPRRFVPTRNSLNQGFNGDVTQAQISSSFGLSFRYLDQNSIPSFLQEATAELALFLMERANSGKNQVSQYTDQVANLSLGGGAVALEFRKDADYITDLPYQVYHIISDFLREVSEYDPSLKAAYTTRLNRS